MSRARTIALFGGSFNPPGNHHAAIALKLSELFDEVRVIPCGPRPDKPVTGTVPPVFRAALADLVFGGMPKVIVDLSDFEQDTFTRNFELEERFGRDPEVEAWHIVGEDLIVGGAQGQSPIQRTWAKGPELWETANFAVLRRPGYESTAAPGAFIADLPPNARIIDLVVEGSSTTIRDRLNRGEDVRAMLSARALAYIERYGLYRAPIPGNWARGTLEQAHYFLCGDTASTRVQAVTARLGLAMPAQQEEPEGLDAPRARSADSGAAGHAPRPGFIAVVGGDGAMLRCIREHWRARLPFFGINAGHIGFLMNGEEQVQDAGLPPADVIFRQLPMLFLEFEDAAGNKTTAYGFNDAWLERATAQSAWLEVSVNGIPRIPKLVSDGALVATAAGSTAYARSMGASPLLADTPAWLLVGSNVLQPAHWRSALLSPDTTVEIRCLDPHKRPVQAYVDGQSILGQDSGLGPIVAMRARLSRAAAAELVFCASHDMAEKIAAIQFGA